MRDILKHGVKPIHSDDDYYAALRMLEENWDPEPGSAKADLFEILCVLVEAYEQAYFKVEATYDPVDVIKFWADQKRYNRKHLEKFIGSRARVADVLNRKRPLSLTMIRNLVAAGLPAQMLIGEIKLTGLAKSDKKKRTTTVSRVSHAHA